MGEYAHIWGGVDRDYDEYSDGEDEVVEIRTRDAKGEMMKIRAEKKQTMARVKALMVRRCHVSSP